MPSLTTSKVITFNRETKDFDATFDGNYIGSFRTFSDAENALNDHVLDLCEQGLVDLPLALQAEQALVAANPPHAAIPDDTEPGDYSDVPAGEGEPARQTLVPAVRTTARAWLAEDWRRDAEARAWSRRLRDG